MAVDRFLWVEVVAVLREVPDGQSGPELDRSPIGIQFAQHAAHERGFAGTIGPDDAPALPAFDVQCQVMEQHLGGAVLVGVRLAQFTGGDHDVAGTLGLGQVELHVVELDRAFQGVFLGAFELGFASLGLLGSLACLVLPDVRLFAFEHRLLLFPRPQHGHASLDALLAECGVVAGVVQQASVLDLDDAGDDLVEQVAIVGDEDDRAWILFAQKGFEPFSPGDIEMVGGLVEQQHARVFQQQSAKRDAGFLPAREVPDFDIELIIAEPEPVQDHLDLVLVAVPARGFNRLLDPLLLFEELFEGLALGFRHVVVEPIELLVELIDDLKGPCGCFLECVVRFEVGVLVEVADPHAL